MPQGTWDLHSLTRHLTHVPSPAPEVQSSNGLPGKSQNTVTFKVYFLNSLKTFYLVVLLFSGKIHIRSDQISRSVVSDSLRPHELQHARPPCPSPTPGVHSDSRIELCYVQMLRAQVLDQTVSSPWTMVQSTFSCPNQRNQPQLHSEI